MSGRADSNKSPYIFDTMGELNDENAIIEQALLLYHQHLKSQQDTNLSQFPRNGKSVATAKDLAFEQHLETRLQTIAALLESRGQFPRESPRKSLSTGRTGHAHSRPLEYVGSNSHDTEPYINPFSGQMVFPVTPYTPGPSNSAISSVINPDAADEKSKRIDEYLRSSKETSIKGPQTLPLLGYNAPLPNQQPPALKAEPLSPVSAHTTAFVPPPKSVQAPPSLTFQTPEKYVPNPAPKGPWIPYSPPSDLSVDTESKLGKVTTSHPVPEEFYQALGQNSVPISLMAGTPHGQSKGFSNPRYPENNNSSTMVGGQFSKISWESFMPDSSPSHDEQQITQQYSSQQFSKLSWDSMILETPVSKPQGFRAAPSPQNILQLGPNQMTQATPVARQENRARVPPPNGSWNGHVDDSSKNGFGSQNGDIGPSSAEDTRTKHAMEVNPSHFNVNPSEQHISRPGKIAVSASFNHELDDALRLVSGITDQFTSLTTGDRPQRPPAVENVQTQVPRSRTHMSNIQTSAFQEHWFPSQPQQADENPVKVLENLRPASDQSHKFFSDPSATSQWQHNSLRQSSEMTSEIDKVAENDAPPAYSSVPSSAIEPRGSLDHFRDASYPDDAQLARDLAEQDAYDELEALRRLQDEWNAQDANQLEAQEAAARRIQDEWNRSEFEQFQYQQNVPGGFPGDWEITDQQQYIGQGSYLPTIPADRSHHEYSGRAETITNGISSLDDDLYSSSTPVSTKTPALRMNSKRISLGKAGSKRQADPSQQESSGPSRRVLSAEEEIARYYREHQEREQKAKQEADARDAAERQAKLASRKDKECVACGEMVELSNSAALDCKHVYCGDCLGTAFKHALAAGKAFRCCGKVNVPTSFGEKFLPRPFIETYRNKVVELETPNPIYCAFPGCSAFIPPSSVKGPLATCLKCAYVTCRLCKNPEHHGVCPPDQDGKKLLNLASNKNWKQCSRCDAVVERNEGCLHITCTCGHEFCYNCGGLWDRCGGSCPRTY